MDTVPHPPDVFTWPSDEPQLIGARCESCSAVTFPMTTSCPRCGTPGLVEHLLPRRGTLWTWTTQDFLPKEPYASGETSETFRVEARLTEADPAELDFGMAVQLVVVPFRRDGDTTTVTFAFAPVQED